MDNNLFYFSVLAILKFKKNRHYFSRDIKIFHLYEVFTIGWQWSAVAAGQRHTGQIKHLV